MNIPVQVSMGGNSASEAVMLLRTLVEKQSEQNSLLSTMLQRQDSSAQTNKQWKDEHKDLAKRCSRMSKKAAELLNQMIEQLVEDLEALEDDENWGGSLFALNELIDKYGYRLQQFNMILHTLGQLGQE